MSGPFGDSKTIQTTSSTTYTEDGSSASSSDVKVGSQIVAGGAISSAAVGDFVVAAGTPGSGSTFAAVAVQILPAGDGGPNDGGGPGRGLGGLPGGTPSFGGSKGSSGEKSAAA